MIRAWFDGVCEPKNPGGYAAFGALVELDGKVVLRKGGYVGNGPLYSNNVAEYAGFLAVAEECVKLHRMSHIHGDSRLVINQLLGYWRVNGGLYFPWYKRAVPLWEELHGLGSTLEWIPREQNEICDVLSKEVLKKMGVKFRIQPEVA